VDTQLNLPRGGTTTPDAPRRGAPRLVYADPFAGADKWRAALAGAADAGLDGIVVPTLLALGAGPARKHLADPSAARSGAAPATLAAEAHAHGLALVMDVALDGVADGSSAAQAGGSAFRASQRHLDPRRPVPTPGVALAADRDAVAAFWAARLTEWSSLGIAGFRLTGLKALPPDWLAPILRRLRDAVPAATLLGWTPGLPREALAEIPAGVLDGLASSFPWWDGRADWFWTELAALRAKAPVVVSPEPFDGDFGAVVHEVEPARLAVSAVVGDGWLVPARLLAAATPWAKAAAQPGTAIGLLGSGPVLALARADADDLRQARHAAVLVANLDPQQAHEIPVQSLLVRLGAGPDAVRRDDGRPMPDRLAPGEAVMLTAMLAGPDPATAAAPVPATEAVMSSRIVLENPSPCVDGGRYPVKRLVGELVEVEVDVVGDGHDKLGAVLRWQGPENGPWQEAPMRPLGNDRWTGRFPLSRLGLARYQIQAWRDAFATFRDELSKKVAAGIPVALEIKEGLILVDRAVARSTGALRDALHAAFGPAVRADAAQLQAALLAPETAELMRRADDRAFAVELPQPVPIRVERQGAAFASWYEVFPRSLSDDETRHGTFRDVERHLPRVAAMGFDVLYFPPFHPIGRTNRKGRNNALRAEPGDPGSPYAIGSDEGGHDALHPELGTLEDFRHLVAAAAEHRLELAMDFAIQCSPDHPWLKQHPEWFVRRPDGTIRFAENPPKKYEDIVNVDFYAGGGAPGLWAALRDAVVFWAEQGVRLFRVDNPHTKPLPFWEWMIADVQARFPDTVFLAEAFTRPKVMYQLAKSGFSQSYTYFTWRHTKAEFQDYLTELTQGPPRDFFRPHFFVNTPDINPYFLQTSGRPGFLIRAALGATLSGLWGVYTGFELCEAAAVPGKEEYLDSEKYQLRAWDWARPGNIVLEITQLNHIRRRNPALQTHLGVTFLPSGSDGVLYFEKATPERDNVVLVAISLDPFREQRTGIEVPFWRFGLPQGAPLLAEDLLTGDAARWPGGWRDIVLTPSRPYALWRLSPAP
jgi:starch synthase (maltosyl-transferring)